MRNYYTDENGVIHIVECNKSTQLAEILVKQKEAEQLQKENDDLLDEIIDLWTNLFHKG